jgi:hypothetical protein
MSRREMVSFDAFLADDTIFDNKNPLLITIWSTTIIFSYYIDFQTK